MARTVSATVPAFLAAAFLLIAAPPGALAEDAPPVIQKQIGQIGIVDLPTQTFSVVIDDIAGDSSLVVYRPWADEGPLPEGDGPVVVDGPTLAFRAPNEQEATAIREIEAAIKHPFRAAAIGTRHALTIGRDGFYFPRGVQDADTHMLERKDGTWREVFVDWNVPQLIAANGAAAAVSPILKPFIATTPEAGLKVTDAENQPVVKGGVEVPNPVGMGKLIYNELACWGCHRVNGHGGLLGPDLTHVGTRMPSIAWHLQHLKDPQSVDPRSAMPALSRLEPRLIKALAEAMMSLK